MVKGKAASAWFFLMFEVIVDGAVTEPTAPATEPTAPATLATICDVDTVVPVRATAVVGEPTFAQSTPASPVALTSRVLLATVGANRLVIAASSLLPTIFPAVP